MKDKKIIKIEEELGYDDNSNDLPPSDIVAFNELRSCADLLRLYQSNQLDIQPDFQREIVWSKPDQSRFIDSLTKQLPIPSMCISLDYKTDKRLIIDGLQRMRSIINFLSDDEWKLSELEDIDTKLSGKTVHTIKTKFKEIFERVQNVMIPVTVIRCDYSKIDHNEYLFTIFHRLNSGGIKLNNQEIRNCIYNGKFNSFLKDLGNSKETKKLLGTKTRFANEELILRFFSFNENLNNYNGKLSKFLNDYMFSKRELDDNEILEKTKLYKMTITFISDKFFKNSSASSLGKTFMEGLLYGVSQNLEYLKNQKVDKVEKLYENFKLLPQYSIQNLKEGLAAKNKVKERFEAANKCFAG